MPGLPKIAEIGNVFATRFFFALALLVCAFAGFISARTQTITQSSTSVITDPAQITSKQNPLVQPFTIEKLYMTHAIGDSTWSPDDKQVAFVTNISGRNNIWIVSSHSGWPTQLTVSNQRQTNIAWSPKGRWIAYNSDYDGNEQWDLFVVAVDNGQVVNLTNTPDIAEEGAAWSPDGEKLAYSVKPRHSPNYEIDTIDILTKKVTHVTANTPAQLSNVYSLWSKDGKSIVFTQQRADGKDANIFIVSASGGQATDLTPHQGEHNFQATDISPDGKTLLITSNSGNGYQNAALLDVASKRIAWLTNEKWEVSSGGFSRDGKRVTWTANVDGNQDIFVYDLMTKQAHALVARGTNSLVGAETGESGFSHDGSRLLYRHEAANAPNDLWTFDFAAQKPLQITHSLVGGLRSEDMVEPFLVHYSSKDGKWQISAFVYVPYNAERNGQNAALIAIHGGPDDQARNAFSRNIQYLVNQGYFVIAPNYRGSAGYGKEFEDADRFDMGGGDLDDVIAAAEWMKKTGFIDPKKLAVAGGSYGGYLTMMAVTKAPDLWAAGVPIVPFVNWFTEIENEDAALREYDIATMGDPVKDKARLQDRSPINFVDRIKAPLLLLAGGNDPRCPRTEAEQVASAVKKRGGVVELKVYENEGHGFVKVENQIDAYTRLAEFLKKYVPPAKCGCNIE